jgi:dTDP-4-dehydrorhamnose reductase
MTVMVVGAGGRLGAAVVEAFRRNHRVVALKRNDLDIRDDAAVDAAAAAARADAIVNCAAFNDVDGAEDEPVAAFEVNAFGVQALAAAAAKRSATFVHFSSDFVFDGRTDRPYTEDDRPGPLSVYGASKLVGEWMAREAPRHYVLRVESLFGGGEAVEDVRAGSVDRILDAVAAGAEVPVFVDRVVSPTYVPDAAAALVRLLELAPPDGVYHCVGSGSCTWAEFAQEAARLLGRPPKLKPITLESVSLRARRPRYCALSNARLAAAGIPMPHWRDALSAYLRARNVVNPEP